MFLLFYFRESIELGNTSFSQSEGEEGEILSESEEGIVTNTEAEIILQRSYDEISLKDISILLQTNIETAKESDISTESIDINDIPMPLSEEDSQVDEKEENDRNIGNREDENGNSICRFFIKGYCKYGENCRYEHAKACCARYIEENRALKQKVREQGKILEICKMYLKEESSVFDDALRTKPEASDNAGTKPRASGNGRTKSETSVSSNKVMRVESMAVKDGRTKSETSVSSNRMVRVESMVVKGNITRGGRILTRAEEVQQRLRRSDAKRARDLKRLERKKRMI